GLLAASAAAALSLAACEKPTGTPAAEAETAGAPAAPTAAPVQTAAAPAAAAAGPGTTWTGRPQAFDYTTWDGNLGGGESSQYSSLDQITKDNVSQLQVAWTYGTGERGSYRFNPLVLDGTMFVLAHNNSLVALDAATGEEKWR